MISRRDEFSPRASQVGSRLRLGGAPRWTAGLVRWSFPWARVEDPSRIRRSLRSQPPRWDFSMNVPQGVSSSS